LLDKGEFRSGGSTESEVARLGRHHIEQGVGTSHQRGSVDEHRTTVGGVTLNFERLESRIAIVEGKHILLALVKSILKVVGVGDFCHNTTVLLLKTEIEGCAVFESHTEISGVGHGRNGSS